MWDKLKKPQVLVLIITLLFQGLSYGGVIVPPDTIQQIINLVTLLAGGSVVYKSDKDSLL